MKIKRTANIQQAGKIISAQLALMAQQPELAHQLPPLMLWGAPGIGKSSLIAQICQEQGIGFIDIRLAQREPIDMRGLPVPKDDYVDWLLAGEWPRDPNSRGIILFDELTAADRSLQVAAYELILDRRLGDLYQLPNGWMVIAAGNRASDRAVATSLSSALANRFCHINLEADLESWVGWASAQQFHPDIVAFLRYRPEQFFSMEGEVEQGWPSPRSWARVAYVLKHLSHQLDATTEYLMIEGLVGSGCATEFKAFRRWSHQLPDVQAMLDGKIPIEIPERADQKYALSTAIGHYLWNDDLKIPEHRILRFFEIGEQLTSDFATLALMDAINDENPDRKQQKTMKLLGHPAFEQWSQQHGNAFQTFFSRQSAA